MDVAGAGGLGQQVQAQEHPPDAREAQRHLPAGRRAAEAAPVHPPPALVVAHQQLAPLAAGGGGGGGGVGGGGEREPGEQSKPRGETTGRTADAGDGCGAHTGSCVVVVVVVVVDPLVVVVVCVWRVWRRAC